MQISHIAEFIGYVVLIGFSIASLLLVAIGLRTFIVSTWEIFTKKDSNE